MASKYKSVRTVVDNIIFDSAKEAHRYSELKILLRAGIIRDLEWQIPYALKVNGILVCTWVADFRYQTKEGKTVIEDTKGFRTRDYRIKAKLFHALHRDLRITEL